MSKVMSYKGKTPIIGKDVLLAEGSIVIGDVVIGDDSSVWFNTVIRGDVNYIRIGKNTNIQDNTVIHVTHDTYPTIIGDNVTIGHSAVIHGCVISNFVLVGMGAIVMDGSFLEEYTLVGAGALITPNKRFPGGTLVAGYPAKVVRDLKKEEIELIKQSSINYVNYKNNYLI